MHSSCHNTVPKEEERNGYAQKKHPGVGVLAEHLPLALQQTNVGREEGIVTGADDV